MSSLRAVLFDIDDTLSRTSEFAQQARANAVHAMIAAGLDAPEEVVLRELDEVIAEFSSNYEHHFDELLQRLPPERRERVNPALIVAAGVAAYHDTKFRELAPFPDVVPLLAALTKAGRAPGLITHGLDGEAGREARAPGSRPLPRPQGDLHLGPDRDQQAEPEALPARRCATSA